MKIQTYDINTLNDKLIAELDTVDIVTERFRLQIKQEDNNGGLAFVLVSKRMGDVAIIPKASNAFILDITN